MKRLAMAVVLLALMIPASAGATAAGGDGGGGYRYAFPLTPSLSTIRNMLLHNCVPITYPNVWACPDAPPYTYA